jgi:hypothetical protein
MSLYFVRILIHTAIFSVYNIKWMCTVAQLFDALHYKPEGRGFVFRLRNSKLSFLQYYDPGVDSASDRNEYQGYLLGANVADA